MDNRITDKPAVIILNYNSYEETLNLINSIDKYDPGYCIIVVDNASGKNERQKLSAIRERCVMVLLDENKGYASGNNAGIRKAIELGYDTFLLANSDTYLIGSHAISDCYAYMKKSGIDILGPKMVNETGADISGCICVDRYGRTKHRFTDDITECSSLGGAFILINRQVTDRIGFIREFYFLYREETDYCLRAHKEGLKIVYYPKVTIVHKAGVTTKNVAVYYYHRNMFILSREIYKTGNFELAAFYFPRFLVYSLRIIKKTGTGKEKRRKLKQLWHAYIDGVRDIRGVKNSVAKRV